MADMPAPEMVEVNGIQLAVYRAGPDPSDTDKPAVFFLHGFPEIAYSWRAQLKALGDAGYPVFTYDARGYGASDAPKGRKNYTVAKLCADAEALLDHYGLRDAVFVGHDWGALTLWAMPFYMGDRVAGYAGLNVPLMPLYREDPIALFRRHFGDKMYIVRFQTEGACEPVLEKDLMRTFRYFLRKPGKCKARAGEAPKPDTGFSEKNLDLIGQLEQGEEGWGGVPLLPDEELQIYADAYRKNGFTGPLHWYRNMTHNWQDMQRFADADGKLPFVARPCLMITAELDRACPPSLADGMENLCGPYERIDLKGCGHWSQQERAADVNAALLDWLHKYFPC
ncbi:alpha/beta fold hydrolase [Kordiimonas marina]|uniref:alpha/beta fold hydrolase n=1 Tax=Kordiimonas marina TaxID=2872312 RepID=UPI001FF3447B|nr:alpha/beta hydrolase [Kordiimonas marina]MCJ9429388.1 alpha/beta hydrolase [Kordiimonas marina]